MSRKCLRLLVTPAATSVVVTCISLLVGVVNVCEKFAFSPGFVINSSYPCYLGKTFVDGKFAN